MWMFCFTVLTWAAIPKWYENIALVFDSIIIMAGLAIAGLIAWAAWNGWPQDFNRESWWTAFMLVGIAGFFLFTVGRRMTPDVLWQFFAQSLITGVGFALLLVAWGCGLAIITFRRRTPPGSR